MIRQAPRCLLRQFQSSPLTTLRLSPRQTRLVSTSPPVQRPRSWKSFLVRGGLAVGVVYYYNTSNLFAEEPAYAIPPSQTASEEETALPTVDSLITPRAAEAPVPTLASKPYVSASAATRNSANTATTTSIPPLTQSEAALSSPLASQPSLQHQETQHQDEQPSSSTLEPSETQDPQDLEDSAHSQGAFNEETGEINWDCPCLGGMAHGTCGENFRAAFSCFVFSNEEPKGMDCIEKFKEMQSCFREHPEEYGAELEDEGEEGDDDEMYVPGDGDAADAEQAGMAHGRSRSVGDSLGSQAKYPSGEPLPEAAERGVRDAEKVTIASEKARLSPSSTTATTTIPSPNSPSPDKTMTEVAAGGSGTPSRRAKAANQQPVQTLQRSEDSFPGESADTLVPQAAHDARGVEATSGK